MKQLLRSGIKRGIWRLWYYNCRSALREFEAALEDPVTAQERALRCILLNAEGSRFADKYGITGSTTLEAFREQVPVQEEDALASWVNEIRKGNQNILENKKVERLVPTSGTTGPHKLIPMTRKGRLDYAMAVNLWVGQAIRSFPDMTSGSCYVATSPVIPFDDPESLTPVGYAKDSDYVGFVAGIALAGLLVVPGTVSNIGYERWRERTRDRLWNARDLSFLSIWHPSYISNLFTDEELRQLPSRWPNLRIISCWADGPVRTNARNLCDLFPKVVLQPKGLWLTEGVISIPWRKGNVAAILTTLLEFEADDGDIMLVHELKAGELYRPIISNRFGLYRYRTGDLVRVSGFEGGTPVLEWIGRADRVSDLCGEKLSEGQVVSAIEACGCRDYVLALPVHSGQGGHYLLIVPKGAHLDSSDLESRLMKNPHYSWARKLGQLHSVQISKVTPQSVASIKKSLLDAQGIHIKSNHLLLDPPLIEEILGIIQ